MIYTVLFAFAAAGALLAGYAMSSSRHGSVVHENVFAASLALALFLILEIEFPRQGLITLEGYDDIILHVVAGTDETPVVHGLRRRTCGNNTMMVVKERSNNHS